MASLCRQIVRGNAVRSVLFSSARRGYADKSKISSFHHISLPLLSMFSYVMSKKSYISFRFWKKLKIPEIIAAIMYKICFTKCVNILHQSYVFLVSNVIHDIDLFWFCRWIVKIPTYLNLLIKSFDHITINEE